MYVCKCHTINTTVSGRADESFFYRGWREEEEGEEGEGVISLVGVLECGVVVNLDKVSRFIGGL